jgi:hypothetical protein
MSYSPTLIVHIFGGSLGLLSGTAAMVFRKGSPRHVLAGRIFVASMLTMAAFAAYLATVRHQPNNIGGGIFTFYLIGTAWLTARRKDGETNRFDWVIRYPHVDDWYSNRAQRRELTRRCSCRNDLFHGFGDVAGCHGGRAHAGARRCCWNKAHRAASLAHVLWAVHRGRIFFPGAAKPPA